MPKKSKEPEVLPRETVYLSRGLEGQDDNIDTLMRLWEELQLGSVDAGKAADVDLIAFAHECFYFGVISCKLELSPAVPKDVARAENSSHFSLPPLNVDKDIPLHTQLEQEWNDEEEPVKPPTWNKPSSIIPTPIADDWNRHKKTVIGLVYLIASPSTTLLDINGELTIGIIVDSPYRGHGRAREAVTKVLQFAFDVGHAHRVQALLMDGPSKHAALTLFTQTYVVIRRL